MDYGKPRVQEQYLNERQHCNIATERRGSSVATMACDFAQRMGSQKKVALNDGTELPGFML